MEQNIDKLTDFIKTCDTCDTVVGRGRRPHLRGVGAGHAGAWPEAGAGGALAHGEAGQRGPELQHDRVQRVPPDDEQTNA